MTTTKLAKDDIDRRMSDYPAWAISGDALQRTFNFDDFKASMAFVNEVADLAERHQHHPDIMIRYNKITLTLSTHDAGGLTEKDFSAARDIDAIECAD